MDLQQLVRGVHALFWAFPQLVDESSHPIGALYDDIQHLIADFLPFESLPPQSHKDGVKSVNTQGKRRNPPQSTPELSYNTPSQSTQPSDSRAPKRQRPQSPSTSNDEDATTPLESSFVHLQLNERPTISYTAAQDDQEKVLAFIDSVFARLLNSRPAQSSHVPQLEVVFYIINLLGPQKTLQLASSTSLRDFLHTLVDQDTFIFDELLKDNIREIRTQGIPSEEEADG